MKAALYARVASCSQKKNENGIENQPDQLKAYCKLQIIQVEKVYYDVGSEMDFNRKGYKKMMADIEEGVVRVHLLICTENILINRNPNATLLVAKSLLKHGVELKFINSIKYKQD